MTVVVEISFAAAQATSSMTRLAALARNDRRTLRMTVGTVRMTVMAVIAVLRTMLRMVVEVLAWGVVIGARGFVIAAADGFVERVVIWINIEGEAALTATGRAGMAAAWIGVFLKRVVV